ncbi:MAG: peptidoglycan DD-metalloendopeptidase family protein [Nitrospinae bacterium]|nr:peptidoglycan DD-metalloendopeptidase family protein [Nitrospinota bacterium]
MSFTLKKPFLKIAAPAVFFTIISTTVFCSETARMPDPLPEEKLLKVIFEDKKPEAQASALDPAPSEAEETKTGKTTSLEGKIPEGGNFYIALKKHGLDNSELHELIESAKKVHNISMLPEGTPYELELQGRSIVGLAYETDKEHVVSIAREKGRYHAKIVPVKFEVKTVIKGAIIEDNLYNAIIRMGEKPSLAHGITEIFAWDIDFFKDLKKGDSLQVAIEKKYRDGKFVKYGQIIGAQIIRNGEKITAIYFPQNRDYFTPEGKSLKKQFLKAPLKYSQISSGFSTRRFHPILQKNVPHLSVDYSAPVGTPVYAVADGEVYFAGNSGPSGKLIRIKHNGVYSSAYCHLAGFAGGIKAGTAVKQGQFIGTVGMTGRTTGPHLCFHLRKNGVPINPLEFKTPKAKPVPENQWGDFVGARKEVLDSFATLARKNIS